MQYIVAVVISLVLMSILFFSLRSTVKRIDYNTKKYFIDKLQDYDYLIEEKKKILNDLKEEIENNKEVLSKKSKVEEKNINNKTEKYYDEFKIPKYSDENLFKKYKKIKEKFLIDEEKIILNFIKNINQKDNKDYNVLLNIRKKIDNKKIYEIIKLELKEQKKYIYNCLNEEEIRILEKHIKINNMKINLFITELDMFLEKNDPTVYVYTGEKNKNFNYISTLIKTEYDEGINEGIKINYKGILYDYSL